MPQDHSPPPQKVQQQVQAFYEEMPFNFYTSTEKTCKQLQNNPIENMYPDLHELLSSGHIKSVLDCGCGAGWLVNSIAYHYDIKATGIDMTGAALARAKEVSEQLGLTAHTRFIQTNLFEHQDNERYDLITSIGVLHHTHDAMSAFKHLQQFNSDEGFFYLGLYHHYGRKVFLDMFREIIKNEGETAAREVYRKLDGTRLKDDQHLESWFRDQVIHPHETQHTLEEVISWFDEAGYSLLTTSINEFDEINEQAILIEQEKTFAAISHQANVVEERYFPGFFTALGVKTSA